MDPDASTDPPAARSRGPRAVLRHAAAWFQATPAELLGLTVLLTGALLASVLLWWSAAGRPSVLPGAAAGVSGPAISGDGVAPAGAGAGSAAGDGWAADGSEGTEEPQPVTVHVSGAVGRPGVVELPPGARVADAIAAVGGAAPGADLDAINLARPLVDGEQVHVLRVGEDPPPAALDGSGAIGPDGRLDLNLATAEELQTLPGIGPAKAAAIIEHREANGPFALPGDLRAVPGIGERTFQNLAERVTVR